MGGVGWRGGHQSHFGAFDQAMQFANVDRLAQIVDGAPSHRLNRGGGITECRHQRHRRSIAIGANGAEQLKAAHTAHAQIGDDQIRTSFVHPGNGCGATVGLFCLMPDLAEELGQAQTHIRMIVDEEDTHVARLVETARQW